MAEYISVDDGLKTNVKLIDKKCFNSKWDFSGWRLCYKGDFII